MAASAQSKAGTGAKEPQYDPVIFGNRLAETGRSVTDFFEKALGPACLESELARPPQLLAAMRYGVLNGGKRLRPFLVVESAALFDIAPEHALPVAAAVECVHCYSLIHDDLPAMDDDDLRRGKPTVHRKFDEATAILAGDALLTFAFDLIASQSDKIAPEIANHLIVGLARAAGMGGMVGGQNLDLAAENSNFTLEQINQMQAMKTGTLIRFSCEAGAILAGADETAQNYLRLYGEKIGAAFQLADDLLDVTATKQAMGKATAKDAKRGKATLIAHLGIDAARKKADDLVGEAEAALGAFGAKADLLRSAAQYIIDRDH